MRDQIVKSLIAAAAFAFLAILVTQMQSSLVVAFLLLFGILALLFLGFLASFDIESKAPQTDPGMKPLPIGFGRKLLERMPLALVLINERGRISYANSFAQALDPRVVNGDHYANLFRVPQFVETVNAVLQDGESRDVQFSVPGQDRVYSAKMIQLPAGSDLGPAGQVIMIIEDRTKDHHTEQMRSDFIANASHELRTPLASVMGYIETMQGHAKDDPQAQERFLGIMAKQAARMHRLVEDLMSLSRIELNAHVTPSETCDIHAIVLDVGAALRPVAQKAETELRLRLVPGMAMVRGDYDQLVQVATNLIDNAIKYGAGGTVSVFQADPNEKYPRMVGITVADQGNGISRDHLHRLTERFYRVNVAKSRNVGGTGLGLAIVKHILNRHEGELQIKSQEGEGSQFTFWVPAVDDSVVIEAPSGTDLEKIPS